MAIPTRFIFHQGAALSGLGRVALASATAPLRRRLKGDPEVGESRTFEKTTEPPSPDLVRRYLEHIGGRPADYDGALPPHLFPQWTFDMLAKTLQHLTYPLHTLVNGGCRLEVNGRLPDDERLSVSAKLVEVDESPSRVRLHHVIETGPIRHTDAIVAHMFNVLPRSPVGPDSAGKREESDSESRRPKIVPEGAFQLEHWVLDADAGIDFAKLTGDFNPIHWLAPAARAAGFSNTILHGFSTMARAFEGLKHHALRDDETLRALDVRFTNPLELPAEVGLYVDEDEAEDGEQGVFVGDGPGERAYMIGSGLRSKGG